MVPIGVSPGRRPTLLHRLQTVDFDVLAAAEKGSLLDVGCGSGYLLARGRRRVRRVVGLDLSLEALSAARARLERQGPPRGGADLLLGDAARLPFVGGAFDAVICTETLEHVPDDASVLAELARVLKPGGRLVLSVPEALPEAILLRLAPWTGCVPGGHLRIYGRRAVEKKIRRAGLLPYAARRRHFLEAIYWIALVAVEDRPWLRQWALAPLRCWRRRRDREPYSLLYHLIDRLGNRLLPKSLVIYARKPSQERQDASGP